jgi:hypothetical protein
MIRYTITGPVFNNTHRPLMAKIQSTLRVPGAYN